MGTTRQHARPTSRGLIVTLAIVSVALIVVPAGVYAGIVLAGIVLATVIASESLRGDPRMIVVSAIALVTTVGAVVASRTLGS